MKTRVTCQRIVDDPSTNEARREHWKSNVEDAESLIKHSRQQQISIEAELQQLVTLLEEGKAR